MESGQRSAISGQQEDRVRYPLARREPIVEKRSTREPFRKARAEHEPGSEKLKAES
jgi:hypothetical protein